MMQRLKTSGIVLVSLAVLVAVIYIPSFLYTRHLAAIQHEQGVTETLPVYNSDSSGYVSLADTILSHGYFGHYPGGSDTFRTPGYPGLLAGWKLLFGSYTFFPLLQILLVYGTAFFIYRIGRELFSETVGVVAAVLFVIDPAVIYHALVLLSEIPYVFLISFSFFLLLAPPRWFPVPTEFLIGLILGLSVLVRPVSVYLPIVFILYLVIRGWKREKTLGSRWIRKTAVSCAILLLAFSAAVFPWLVRNYRVSGVVGISSVQAFNLFVYVVPEFLAYRDHTNANEERVKLFSTVDIPTSEYANLAYSSMLQRTALTYVFADPLRFARFYAVKTIPFFVSSGLENIFTTYNNIRGTTVFPVSDANLTNFILSGNLTAVFKELRRFPAVTAEQVVLGLFVVFALLAFLNRKRWPEVLMLFLGVAYFASVTNISANARLRIPALPMLYLLVVVGISTSVSLCVKRFRKDRTPQAL